MTEVIGFLFLRSFFDGLDGRGVEWKEGCVEGHINGDPKASSSEV